VCAASPSKTHHQTFYSIFVISLSRPLARALTHFRCKCCCCNVRVHTHYNIQKVAVAW
jgi:hypothetical protein